MLHSVQSSTVINSFYGANFCGVIIYWYSTRRTNCLQKILHPRQCTIHRVPSKPDAALHHASAINSCGVKNQRKLAVTRRYYTITTITITTCSWATFYETGIENSTENKPGPDQMNGAWGFLSLLVEGAIRFL